MSEVCQEEVFDEETQLYFPLHTRQESALLANRIDELSMSTQEEDRKSQGIRFSMEEADEDQSLWDSPCAWRPVLPFDIRADSNRFTLDTDLAYYALRQNPMASDVTLSEGLWTGSRPLTGQGSSSRDGSPLYPQTPDSQYQVNFGVGSNLWPDMAPGQASAYHDPGICDSLITSSCGPNVGVRLSDIQLAPDQEFVDADSNLHLDDCKDFGLEPICVSPYPGYEKLAGFKTDEGMHPSDFDHRPTSISFREDKKSSAVHDNCIPSPKPRQCISIRPRSSKNVPIYPPPPLHRSQNAKTELNHILGRSRVTKRSPRSSTISSPRPPPSSLTSVNLEKPPSNIPTNDPIVRDCPHCIHPSFTTPGLLAEHIATKHHRPYICIFHAQGCPSDFKKKNEWVRHVKVQHLCLSTYHCTSPLAPGKTTPARNCTRNYSRKDLYIAHLRRLHIANSSPFAQTKIDTLVKEACKLLRGEPLKSLCPFCPEERLFSDWRARMEHVARHLEKGHEPKRVDRWLEEWMIGEKLFTGGVDGKWKVIGVKDVKKIGPSTRSKGAPTASTDGSDEGEDGGTRCGVNGKKENNDDDDDDDYDDEDGHEQ